MGVIPLHEIRTAETAVSTVEVVGNKNWFRWPPSLLLAALGLGKFLASGHSQHLFYFSLVGVR